ncbi:hypothetical protein T492DRAFT_976817 [Pavlovales sp. CCMP2436]|nr:hypothetical protein T492DRAFT_976817 [Pavlovales sp. CCMP2436]
MIALRGCTPLSGSTRRFVVDLGQQNLGSGHVEWEIGLELANGANAGASARYQIVPSDGLCAQWLTLSRTHGKLDTHVRHAVTVRASTDALATLSTYLSLYNLDCPRDVSIVRVTLEVVADAAAAAHCYAVFVEGANAADAQGGAADRLMAEGAGAGGGGGVGGGGASVVDLDGTYAAAWWRAARGRCRLRSTSATCTTSTCTPTARS